MCSFTHTQSLIRLLPHWHLLAHSLRLPTRSLLFSLAYVSVCTLRVHSNNKISPLHSQLPTLQSSWRFLSLGQSRRSPSPVLCLSMSICRSTTVCKKRILWRLKSIGGWAEYAVQCNIREMRSHPTRQGAFVRSQSQVGEPLWTDPLCQRVELVFASSSPLWKQQQQQKIIY